MVAYEAAKVMLKYNISAKLEHEAKKKMDFERESLTLEEIEHFQFPS